MTEEQAIEIIRQRQVENNALMDIAKVCDKLRMEVNEEGGDGDAAVEWVIEQLQEAGE